LIQIDDGKFILLHKYEKNGYYHEKRMTGKSIANFLWGVLNEILENSAEKG
jgi:hypothetical protein